LAKGPSSVTTISKSYRQPLGPTRVKRGLPSASSPASQPAVDIPFSQRRNPLRQQPPT